MSIDDPFVGFAIACAALSAVLLVWFLAKSRPVTRTVKVVLLFGIGILPIATATTGNIAGYHATKETQFCGSCHVMSPYRDDSWDMKSESLAARHARNESFGHENCYACHADYGMFGTITTKIGGMRHVYEYLFNYRNHTHEDFQAEINILRPFRNETCMRCHSTQNPLFNKIGDHASSRDQIRAGTVSCASEGCHGFAHPFSKAVKRARGLLPPAPEPKGSGTDSAAGSGSSESPAAEKRTPPEAPQAPPPPATPAIKSPSTGSGAVTR